MHSVLLTIVFAPLTFLAFAADIQRTSVSFSSCCPTRFFFSSPSAESVHIVLICPFYLPPLPPKSSAPSSSPPLSPSLLPGSLSSLLPPLPHTTLPFHCSRYPSLRTKHVFQLFFYRYCTQVERQEARRDGMTEHMAVLLFVMKVRVCLGAPVPSLSNARACT